MNCPSGISENTQTFVYKEVNKAQMQNPLRDKVFCEWKSVSIPVITV